MAKFQIVASSIKLQLVTNKGQINSYGKFSLMNISIALTTIAVQQHCYDFTIMSLFNRKPVFIYKLFTICSTLTFFKLLSFP